MYATKTIKKFTKTVFCLKGILSVPAKLWRIFVRVCKTQRGFGRVCKFEPFFERRGFSPDGIMLGYINEHSIQVYEFYVFATLVLKLLRMCRFQRFELKCKYRETIVYSYLVVGLYIAELLPFSTYENKCLNQ